MKEDDKYEMLCAIQGGIIEHNIKTREHLTNIIRAISGEDVWFSYSFDVFGAYQIIRASEFLKISNLGAALKKFMDAKKLESKMEIDDLKLRICVLEDAMKEHSRFSARDLSGLCDVSLGTIPSRKNNAK